MGSFFLFLTRIAWSLLDRVAYLLRGAPFLVRLLAPLQLMLAAYFLFLCDLRPAKDREELEKKWRRARELLSKPVLSTGGDAHFRTFEIALSFTPSTEETGPDFWFPLFSLDRRLVSLLGGRLIPSGSNIDEKGQARVLVLLEWAGNEN